MNRAASMYCTAASAAATALMLAAAPLHAAIFTVTQAGGGPAQNGSLAWAVTQSNATAGGPHTINFTTATVQIDDLQGVVPPITRNVVIDGDRGAQPDVDIFPVTGSVYGLPLFDIHTAGLVILRNMRIGGAFRNAVFVALGSDSVILQDLDLGSTQQACVHLRGGTSVIRVVAKDCGNAAGVGASPGERSGIWLETADNVSITGSYIGLGADGGSPDALANFHYGIYAESSQNLAIGGVGVNRNVISNNQLGGIMLSAVDGASIVNNYIGVSVDGSDPDGNGFVAIGSHLRGGIVLLGSSDIQIGASNTPNTRGNVIAASGSGIRIHASTDVRIHGNRIGTNAAGTGGWPAEQPNGIFATGEAIAGGTTQDIEVGDAGNAALANTIGFHLNHGVRLESAFVGEFRVRNNSIWQNGSGAIELAAGANGNIGAPTVLGATTSLVSGIAPLDVAGQLGQVDVYRDLDGQGRFYLGTAQVDPDFGTWSLPVNLAGFENTWQVTATSNTDGRGTSEFSPGVGIAPGVVDLIFADGFEQP